MNRWCESCKIDNFLECPLLLLASNSPATVLYTLNDRLWVERLGDDCPRGLWPSREWRTDYLTTVAVSIVLPLLQPCPDCPLPDNYESFYQSRVMAMLDLVRVHKSPESIAFVGYYDHALQITDSLEWTPYHTWDSKRVFWQLHGDLWLTPVCIPDYARRIQVNVDARDGRGWVEGIKWQFRDHDLLCDLVIARAYRKLPDEGVIWMV